MTTLPPKPAALDDALSDELRRIRAHGRERSLRWVGRRRGVAVVTARGPAIDFSSNDYLGLASDARLADAAARAIREHGIGAAASRLIAGDHPEHEALERDIAAFFGAERALTFSSGYAANTGIIPALVQRGDAIFADALNHASLIDGCRLSRATVHVYAHTDAAALAGLLDQHRGAARRALIVSDGLFSMDGDRAPVADLVDLARRFDAWTYLDDAHAAGVLGDDGRGTASAAGCAGGVDVTIGTLGKAFGAAGAFVHGSGTLVQYLLNSARSFIFSTAMLPAQAAAARAALGIASQDPALRDRLWTNTRHLGAALVRRGLAGHDTDISSPIIPVPVGEEARTMRVGAALAERGYLVGAVRPPTVPVGGSRLRVTVSAAHTTDHIDGLADALAAALRA